MEVAYGGTMKLRDLEAEVISCPAKHINFDFLPVKHSCMM